MANSMDETSCVTLEEFVRQRSLDIDEANKLCQEKYEQRLSKELDKWVLEPTTQKHLWKKAYKLISRSLKVKHAFESSVSVRKENIAAALLNGRATLEQTEENEDVWRTVQNVIEEYQGLFEEAFLLLNAPRGDYEKDARDIHLQDFYNVVVSGQETEKFPSMPCIVNKYEDIKIAVQCFMRCLARNAKRATVVYNGHGKATGHLFLEGESKSPNNTEMLKDIYELWEENKHTTGEDGELSVLPARITVVFAQCYGFIHSQRPEEKEIIKVVSLATPRDPTTVYNFKCGKRANNEVYIKRSVHVQLSAYAKQRFKESEGDEDSSLGSMQSIASSICTEGEEDSPMSISETSNSDSSLTPLDMLVPSLFVSSALRHSTKPTARPSYVSLRPIWEDVQRLSRNWKFKGRKRYTCKSALGDVLKVGLIGLSDSNGLVQASSNPPRQTLFKTRLKSLTAKSGHRKDGARSDKSEKGSHKAGARSDKSEKGSHKAERVTPTIRAMAEQSLLLVASDFGKS